jgi:hypothetical protein
VEKITFIPGAEFPEPENETSPGEPGAMRGFFVEWKESGDRRMRFENRAATFRRDAENLSPGIAALDHLKRRHLEKQIAEPVLHHDKYFHTVRDASRHLSSVLKPLKSFSNKPARKITAPPKA